MTTAVRSARAAVKPVRTLSYNALVGVLTIAQGKDESNYYLDTIRHDLGGNVRCVKLTKLPATRKEGQPDDYDVSVDLTSRVGSCECMGFLRHRKPCRHIAAVLTLIDRNSL
jgi:SWIM zinc finger